MHPGMTSRGKRIAAFLAIAAVLLMPKRSECHFPGQTCGHAGRWRMTCTDYEIEPFSVYLLETVLERDVGLAYSRGEECR